MNQLSLLSPQEPTAWTVMDLNRYVRDLLESDYNLQDVWVTGEISNLSQPRSGHLYFSLKDKQASVRCVMWRQAVVRLRYQPKEGEAVQVHGKVSVYESSGQYQLYVDALYPRGEGALFQAFMRLKAQLEEEGLFDPTRKRTLPAFPKRIGVVTSPTGAAIQDILNTLRRRYPMLEVIVAPTLVQGDQAPAGIIQGILNLNQYVHPDLIILARGGGSIEDLWAFNDEFVARAIVSSQAPVITGVGHETDFTIADFAADLRAPTPTAAAEQAVPDRQELRQYLSEVVSGLDRNMLDFLASARWELSTWQHRIQRVSPEARIRTDRQRLDEWDHRMTVAFNHWFKLQRTSLAGFQQRLGALNPLSVLERGYAIVSHADSQEIIRDPAQVVQGDPLDIRVRGGSFPVTVSHKDPEADKETST